MKNEILPQTAECGVIYFKPFSDVFQSKDLRCSDINHVFSSGRSALVVKILYAFRIYIFSGTFLRIKSSAINIYVHTCACPDKAGQMYVGRVSPQPDLGMIELPQIVQTVNRQVICADLSASSCF